MGYKLSELVKDLDVTLQGDPDCLINGISTIQEARSGCITFLSNSTYRKYLAETKATAVILSKEEAAHCGVNAIISPNPLYTYAQIAKFFALDVPRASGIHPTAVIGEHCDIGDEVTIGPHCVIGDQVKIGARSVIGAGSIIGNEVAIGEESILDARVTLYFGVKVGKRVHLASGVVIGADGFGFANHAKAWHKIPQLGTVVIGDEVDVGANTTIDRGAIQDTIIEEGVKLDNLIQVGHNVRIGANTIIAGGASIAGSVTIGKCCMIGGATCFNGHIEICDYAMITGMTAVTKSILEPGIYSSGIVGAVPNHEFKKNNARFHRLENLMQRVKNLESSLKELKESKERN